MVGYRYIQSVGLRNPREIFREGIKSGRFLNPEYQNEYSVSSIVSKDFPDNPIGTIIRTRPDAEIIELLEEDG